MTLTIQDSIRPHPAIGGIKLVCFDIDGTIMNSLHTISLKTTRCFQFLDSLGIQYGLASGRPYFGVQTLIQSYGFTAPCSLFAGALVVDPQSENTIYEAPLEQSQTNALVEICKTLGAYLELYTLHSFYTALANHPFSRIHSEYLGSMPEIWTEVGEITRRKIFKGCLIVPVEQQPETVAALQATLPDCSIACSPGAAHPQIMFINVTSAKHTRYDTFRALLGSQNLEAKNVISFGDGETDIEFLRSAGIGIAMSNAASPVLAAADFVTASVDDDGVHVALEHLFDTEI